ncbi:MAG TPA: hypothetical protein VF892_00045, partial [Pseudonocardiaceae bacterium]
PVGVAAAVVVFVLHLLYQHQRAACLVVQPPTESQLDLTPDDGKASSGIAVSSPGPDVPDILRPTQTHCNCR